MRIFKGGYKKSDYDKKQEKMAHAHTEKVRAKHRAEMDAIFKAAEQRENDAQLKAAWERFEALKAAS